MTTGKTPVMDALVDFVLGLEPAALPPAVIEAANRSMTDWLGTAIRGSVEPLADAIAAVIGRRADEQQLKLRRDSRRGMLGQRVAGGVLDGHQAVQAR